MVMVIPDSGNITGSQPVLRQSSTVTPMSDARVETMDTAPVADSLKNLGKAYVQFKEQENLAFARAQKSSIPSPSISPNRNVE